MLTIAFRALCRVALYITQVRHESIALTRAYEHSDDSVLREINSQNRFYAGKPCTSVMGDTRLIVSGRMKNII